MTINEKQQSPFIADLPSDGEKYVPVLNRENAAALKSGLVTLQPGESIGSHNTEEKEELILIIEGAGCIETETNGKQPIKQGQIAFNPPQTQHNVINNSSNILRYLYVVARSG